MTHFVDRTRGGSKVALIPGGRRRPADCELSLDFVVLSANAHGTLNALRTLGTISHFEQSAADELVASDLARRRHRALEITGRGHVVTMFLHTGSYCFSPAYCSSPAPQAAVRRGFRPGAARPLIDARRFDAACACAEAFPGNVAASDA